MYTCIIYVYIYILMLLYAYYDIPSNPQPIPLLAMTFPSTSLKTFFCRALTVWPKTFFRPAVANLSMVSPMLVDGEMG